jgi:hypothetical protein
VVPHRLEGLKNKELTPLGHSESPTGADRAYPGAAATPQSQRHSLASVTSATQRSPVSRISFFWTGASHSKMEKLAKEPIHFPLSELKGATGALKHHFSRDASRAMSAFGLRCRRLTPAEPRGSVEPCRWLARGFGMPITVDTATLLMDQIRLGHAASLPSRAARVEAAH